MRVKLNFKERANFKEGAYYETYIDVKNRYWLSIYGRGDVERSRAVWDFAAKEFVTEENETDDDFPVVVVILIFVLIMSLVGTCLWCAKKSL